MGLALRISAAQPARQQPPVHRADSRIREEAEGDTEQDRIEIPAFLRRQAN